MKNKPIPVMIVDDEPHPLNLLEELLKDAGGVEVRCKTSDPFQAPQLVMENKPELIFLDVKMPGMNGFQLLDQLQQKQQHEFEVIFTTAHDEFAVQAFEYAAFDYLLKPIERERLKLALQRYRSQPAKPLKNRTSLLTGVMHKLVFHSLNEYTIVDPDEIVLVKADGNYSHFILGADRQETVTFNLSKIEEQLSPSAFFRVNRSFIINTRYLYKINTKKHQCLLLKNGEEFSCEISQDKICLLAEYFRGNKKV